MAAICNLVIKKSLVENFFKKSSEFKQNVEDILYISQCHVDMIEHYSPFKIDDRVVISKSIEGIDEGVNSGWSHIAQDLKEGYKGTVKDIFWNHWSKKLCICFQPDLCTFIDKDGKTIERDKPYMISVSIDHFRKVDEENE